MHAAGNYVAHSRALLRSHSFLGPGLSGYFVASFTAADKGGVINSGAAQYVRLSFTDVSPRWCQYPGKMVTFVGPACRFLHNSCAM